MPPSTGRQLRRVNRRRRRGAAKGLAVTYLSLLVLIPLAALVTNAFNHGLGAFWRPVTPTDPIDPLRPMLVWPFIASASNAVAGLASAWVLVRDRFVGQGILNAIIDLPF